MPYTGDPFCTITVVPTNQQYKCITLHNTLTYLQSTITTFVSDSQDCKLIRLFSLSTTEKKKEKKMTESQTVTFC